MKVTGPSLNKDFGAFDRPRALFSKMPIGVDFLPDYQLFHDDFLSSVNDATNQWIVVKDTGATALVGTGDLENGAMTLTSTATTDNDGASIQRAECTFLAVAGRDLMFEARVKVSTANDGEMFVGLTENFATNPEAVIVNGIARIGFELVEGSAVINTVIDNDTTATYSAVQLGIGSGAAAMPSMADGVYVKLGFRVDGASIRFYVNRALVSVRDLPTAIATKTLCPAFFHLSGNATGTHTALIDYVTVCAKRE